MNDSFYERPHKTTIGIYGTHNDITRLHVRLLWRRVSKQKEECANDKKGKKNTIS